MVLGFYTKRTAGSKKCFFHHGVKYEIVNTTKFYFVLYIPVFYLPKVLLHNIETDRYYSFRMKDLKKFLNS